MTTPQMASDSPVRVKPFGKVENGTYGFTLFDTAAVNVAQGLGVAHQMTNQAQPTPYVTVKGEEQVGAARQLLASQGIPLIEMQQANMMVSAQGDTATVYGPAALALAESLNRTPATTEKGTPKLAFPIGEKQQNRRRLYDLGFSTKEQQADLSKMRPKILLRELKFGAEGSLVTERSASNLASTLDKLRVDQSFSSPFLDALHDVQLEKTPGGNPQIKLSAEQHLALRQLSEELSSTTDYAIDLNIKAYQPPSISISTFHSKPGGMIVGPMAGEIAASLDMKDSLSFTAPSAKTGRPLPKLSLDAEQLVAVTAYLETTDYRVSLKPLPPMAYGRENDRSVYFYGDTAQSISSKYNVPLTQNPSTQTIAVRLSKTDGTANRVMSGLKADGFEVSVKKFSQSVSKAQQPVTQDSVQPVAQAPVQPLPQGQSPTPPVRKAQSSVKKSSTSPVKQQKAIRADDGGR